MLVRGSLGQFKRFIAAQKHAFGILCFEGEEKHFTQKCITYGAESDPASQAHRLFDALREVDRDGLTLVYTRVSDDEGIGQAVYNRLLRAAGSRSLTACISFFSSSNILMIPPLEKNMNAQEYFLSPSLGLV